MQKRWVIESFKKPDKVAALEKVLGTPAAITSILVHREIETFQAAKDFFRPSLSQLHDPFLMQGMEQAVARLHRAINSKEKILIYGDYDVDGTTAVAMVYGFLRSLPGATLSYYVPDRMIEGYGVSMQAIESAYQNGIKLIITLDCGIKAYAPIARAVQRGIDVIVCDHHEVGASLPPAYAILDPKQPSCSYPFKELSGCGVGFKLLQAFCQRCGLKPDMLYDYLDLVAVSTACDIVPLVDENRILAYYGIKQLENSPRPGLQALMELGYFSATITISDIVFKIGPRINAAGRMNHASLAVQLLIEQDLANAYKLAQSINQQNLLRQSLDYTITQEALTMIENNAYGTKSTVLFNPDWHKGIIGIVASRCIEQCYRPTVILTLADGKATGSARSIPGYNIYEAISECSPLLDQYGGHAFAAGLTMPLAHMTTFQQQFEEVVSATITDDLLIPQQSIHALISFQAITQKFVNILMQMAPFGPGNATPVFASEKVYARKCHLVKEKHLKLEVYQIDGQESYEAIGFGLGGYLPLVATGKPFAMAYTIGYNYYLGHKSLQFMIKDIKEEPSIV
ncbi:MULTISPECIES: single-stranded-DNA-specific exonuclease RecJ [unclassified Candidatus Cardinium]|uniref:single-stranded-DNA-specific exonuclease RecJ n=1 Tax=unclassified Candidatus Cardinium TaxID=2641185 RepID=UPI001FB3BB78|nr:MULTISPECIES: single-stranded-DNA-specific exonuclease RecJ [unclassified Candidatus Cardinium]